MEFHLLVMMIRSLYLKKKNTCHSNPEKLSTAKINKHTTSGCSLFTHCLFDATKNSPDYYKDCKDCMKRISKDLKKHATKIINYEKKRNNTINN